MYILDRDRCKCWLLLDTITESYKLPMVVTAFLSSVKISFVLYYKRLFFFFLSKIYAKSYKDYKVKAVHVSG